jgi:hypothetical protein
MLRSPPTPHFLTWLADRLVNIYGESENVDFVRRVRHEAARAATLRSNLAQNQHTYVLVAVSGDADGTRAYTLAIRGSLSTAIMTTIWLTEQQANDLSRQLDAGVDYFND